MAKCWRLERIVEGRISDDQAEKESQCIAELRSVHHFQYLNYTDHTLYPIG